MEKHIKRFWVYDLEEQKIVAKYDTLQECIDYLRPLWDGEWNTYYDFVIFDLYDDIEVNWADLMGAVDDGECPEDLQMF